MEKIEVVCLDLTYNLFGRWGNTVDELKNLCGVFKNFKNLKEVKLNLEAN